MIAIKKLVKIISITSMVMIFLSKNSVAAVSETSLTATSCAAACGSLSALLAGATDTYTITLNSVATVESYSGTTEAAVRESCTFACETARQKASGGLYIANTKASASSNSFTRVMCNALRVVQGSAGKSFAAFAIIAVGIGFFSGKVSWGLMIGVAAGIAAMFGAPSIVAAVSGQDTNMNCGTKL